MCTNFGSKDGILIRVMTLEDYKQIKGYVYDDIPIFSCVGESTRDIIQQIGEQNYDKLNIPMIEQGTSLVAIDENDGGRIVGHVLGGRKVAGDLEKSIKLADGLEECTTTRLLKFTTEAEIKCNIFEHYGVTQMLYSQITRVERSMRGKGIGTRLAAALMELGRSKGMPLMVASCISFYSARQKEAMGMECIYSQAYADHKNASGEAIFKPAAPHTHLRIMAIRL